MSEFEKIQKKLKTTKNSYSFTTNGDLAFSKEHFLQDEVKSLVALNESVTVKGDFENAKPYLDQIFQGSNKIVKAYALIIAVHTRDIEKGKGLRKPFLQFLDYFYEKGFASFVVKLVKQIPKYGYYKDLCKLYEIADRKKYEILKQEIAKFYIEELKREKEVLKPNEMTNAGKFAPRQQKAFHKFAIKLAEDMFPGSKTQLKDYRKYICEIMSKYKQITEVLMSSKDWDKIDPKYVPSLCFKKYKKCFLNPESDEEKRKILKERYEQHIEKALEGKSKVNAKRLTVNSLAYEFYNNKEDKTELEKQALEAQMIDIVNDIKKKGSVLTNALVVCDVSGSMGGHQQNDPIFGCTGLGIVINELNKGSALGKSIITFSRDPSWVELGDGMTYAEKFDALRKSQWGMNTDFYKTMRLIIDSAKSKENLPKIMFVLSDMQFDQACSQSWSTCYEFITELFENEGFEEDDIPTIVFWNLQGNRKTFTVDSSQKKVICFSGFSQALLKWIVEAKNLEDILNMTPFQFLMEILESERYASVKTIAFQEI